VPIYRDNISRLCRGPLVGREISPCNARCYIYICYAGYRIRPWGQQRFHVQTLNCSLAWTRNHTLNSRMGGGVLYTDELSPDAGYIVMRNEA